MARAAAACRGAVRRRHDRRRSSWLRAAGASSALAALGLALAMGLAAAAGARPRPPSELIDGKRWILDGVVAGTPERSVDGSTRVLIDLIAVERDGTRRPVAARVLVALDGAPVERLLPGDRVRVPARAAPAAWLRQSGRARSGAARGRRGHRGGRERARGGAVAARPAGAVDRRAGARGLARAHARRGARAPRPAMGGRSSSRSCSAIAATCRGRSTTPFAAPASRTCCR